MSIKHIIIFVLIALLSLVVCLFVLRKYEERQAQKALTAYQTENLKLEKQVASFRKEIAQKEDLIILVEARIHYLEDRQDTLIIENEKIKYIRQAIINSPPPTAEDNYKFFSELDIAAETDSLPE